MDISEILLLFGVPSAICGFVFWLIQRGITKREKKKEIHDKNVEKLILLIMQNSRANNILAVATAKAIQRIPDAKCNGDMTKALEMADVIQKEEKDFLMDKGIQHIFED